MKMKQKLAAACALVMATAAAALAAQPAAAASVPDMDAYADAVVALVNEERAAVGLAPVQAVPVLNDAAEVRSAEIVRSFSHTRPDSRPCSTVLNDNNIQWRTTGENIAYGYASPEAVMDGWMHSSGHRANILNGNFEYIGVGVVSEGGMLYWTQVFTGGVELTDAYLPGESAVPSAPEQPEKPAETPENPSVPSVSVPEVTECAGADCGIGDVCPVIACENGSCTVKDIVGLQKYLSGNCDLSDLNGNCGNISGLLSVMGGGSDCSLSTIMGLLSSCGK